MNKDTGIDRVRYLRSKREVINGCMQCTDKNSLLYSRDPCFVWYLPCVESRQAVDIDKKQKGLSSVLLRGAFPDPSIDSYTRHTTTVARLSNTRALCF